MHKSCLDRDNLGERCSEMLETGVQNPTKKNTEIERPTMFVACFRVFMLNDAAAPTAMRLPKDGCCRSAGRIADT